MKALTFHGKRDIRLTDVAPPQLKSPHDALIKVTRTAICGSDLHVYHALEQGIDLGTIMGHEFLGKVVAVGESVAKVAVGDTVVCPFTSNCGHCYYCRMGLTCRCEQGALYGWMAQGCGLEGAQGEMVRVPHADASLLKLTPDLDPDVALFLGDILATGYFAADQAAISSDGVYVVLGCGPVGLMAVLSALELGARTVFAVDMLPERLALAERMGAQPIHLKNGQPAKVVAQATSGRGADAVLEMVGNASATMLAYELVRPGGTISVAGVHTEPHLAISPCSALRQEPHL